ncbi:hypothetical protein CPEBRM1_ABPJDJAI_00146 [Companilactobacillus paralimentarius]|uniref:DNA adenine methylase n=1 Tax=Companilactobacillus paralimentarius TaxID=83526 RepID=UPI00384C36EA
MKKTTEILKKYGITRQTLANWTKYYGLNIKRGVNGHYLWNKESLNNLENFVKIRMKFRSNLRSESSTFNIENRRYLGSKTRMLDFIDAVVSKNTHDVNEIADIFGGTGVVANSFYKRGFNITVNDILDSNYLSYRTFFGKEPIRKSVVKKRIKQMNNLQGTKNYVSENYGNKYFSEENAIKIGAARDFIDKQEDLRDRERDILLTSLLYAMDKSANTVGHYDAYRRILDNVAPIVFKMPNLIENNAKTTVYHEDANKLVRQLKSDLVYIDTPYNSRQYGDVYHVLENIMDWKKPKLYGVAMKPKDRSRTKSLYSTAKAPDAFEDLITHINARYILVSYNNMAHKGVGRSNAKISNKEIIDILGKRGKVQVFDEPFQVFTTGKTHIKDHKELLYLVEVTK